MHMNNPSCTHKRILVLTTIPSSCASPTPTGRNLESTTFWTFVPIPYLNTRVAPTLGKLWSHPTA